MLYDVGVVGAGIVGLATAFRVLERAPGLRVVVFEKESAVARHQSGRNSGVIHSGIYYRPGSEKARTCTQGKTALLAYCARREIPVRTVGKVIVATDDSQLDTLTELQGRGEDNGVATRWVDGDELTTLEPEVSGVAALHVPETAIVDFRRVCEVLRDDIEAASGTVRTASEVVSIAHNNRRVVVGLRTDEIECRQVINCAGLHSDRIARLAGVRPALRIVPFRGEFFEIRPPLADRIRGLVYPVPDPALPFLGVHFTPTINGAVECGPNAVLALGREAYGLTSSRAGEALGQAAWPGLWRLGLRYGRAGLGELWRSLNRRAFVSALQRLVPGVRAADLGARRTGIRAQAVGRDGTLLDDFRVESTERMVHVLNAPSPAATAALAIGNEIADRVLARVQE